MSETPQLRTMPWERTDIRSLNRLCKEAQRLGEPRGGLLGAIAPANRYPSIRAAESALHEHTIYKWLERNLPNVLQRAPESLPLGEFRLVHLLLKYMVMAWAQEPKRARARRDKRRLAAWQASERVARYVADGTITLEQVKAQALVSLLREAQSDLVAREDKPSELPALRGLAYALYRQLGIADPKLLADVGSAIVPDFSERTAERYVQAARES